MQRTILNISKNKKGPQKIRNLETKENILQITQKSLKTDQNKLEKL